MKIGLNARFLSKQNCGNHTYLVNLIRGLARYDTKNEYVIFVDNKIEKNIINLNVPNIRFVLIERNKYNLKNELDWDLKFTIADEFQKEKIDVLHCTHFVVPEILDKNKTKIVVSIHDVFPSRVFRVKPFIEMGFPFKEISSIGLIMRIKEPKMLKKADYVITFSDYIKNEILNFYSYPENKITVIPHFPCSEFQSIDITENKVSRNKLQDIKDKFHLPQRFVAYFSGFHRRKNIRNLIKAFKEVVKKHSDAFLVFIGGGKTKDELEKQHLQNVIFTGKVNKEELVSIVNLSEFVVVPSLYEGFGLSVVESMVCNKLCITSKDSPMMEVAGDSALYFNPRKPSEIYQCFLKILENRTLKKELEEKTKQRILLFKEESHIKNTISIYEKAFAS